MWPPGKLESALAPGVRGVSTMCPAQLRGHAAPLSSLQELPSGDPKEGLSREDQCPLEGKSFPKPHGLPRTRGTCPGPALRPARTS